MFTLIGEYLDACTLEKTRRAITAVKIDFFDDGRLLMRLLWLRGGVGRVTVLVDAPVCGAILVGWRYFDVSHFSFGVGSVFVCVCSDKYYFGFVAVVVVFLFAFLQQNITTNWIINKCWSQFCWCRFGCAYVCFRLWDILKSEQKKKPLGLFISWRVCYACSVGFLLLFIKITVKIKSKKEKIKQSFFLLLLLLKTKIWLLLRRNSLKQQKFNKILYILLNSAYFRSISEY